jgi:hypothetical protein
LGRRATAVPARLQCQGAYPGLGDVVTAVALYMIVKSCAPDFRTKANMPYLGAVRGIFLLSHPQYIPNALLRPL